MCRAMQYEYVYPGRSDRVGGGLNAYGFAAGDPVNYADPFGDSLVAGTQPTSESLSSTLKSIKDGVLEAASDAVHHPVDALKAIGKAAVSELTTFGPQASALGVGAVGATGDAGRLTTSQARDLATYLGYDKKVKDPPFDPHGQPVFTDGKTLISPDVDSHAGGVWKMFDRSGSRMGTFDELLEYIRP